MIIENSSSYNTWFAVKSGLGWELHFCRGWKNVWSGTPFGHFFKNCLLQETGSLFGDLSLTNPSEDSLAPSDSLFAGVASTPTASSAAPSPAPSKAVVAHAPVHRPVSSTSSQAPLIGDLLGSGDPTPTPITGTPVSVTSTSSPATADLLSLSDSFPSQTTPVSSLSASNSSLVPFSNFHIHLPYSPDCHDLPHSLIHVFLFFHAPYR